MINSYELFQIVYLILNEINNQEGNSEVTTYLSDANPFVWNGENSADPALYPEFKDMFEKNSNDKDFYYDFVCKYLSSLTYYRGIYETFVNAISKEDYIVTCQEILKEKGKYFKTF